MTVFVSVFCPIVALCLSVFSYLMARAALLRCQGDRDLIRELFTRLNRAEHSIRENGQEIPLGPVPDEPKTRLNDLQAWYEQENEAHG